MSDLSDFEVMKKMVEQNKDIKCSTSIVELKDNKRGASVTMAVDSPSAQDLMRSIHGIGDKNYVAILYVVNMKDFNEVKYKKEEADV